MNKYQIVEIEGSYQHAGTKATSDIHDIAEELGYKSVYIKMNTTVDSKFAKIKRQFGYYNDFNAAYKTIEKDSIVLLQHPFHNKQLTREKTLMKLKKEKGVKYLSFIHDIEKLRKFRYNDYYEHEFVFMKNIADVIVCHNKVMKEFLINEGIDEKKIIVLEIFDYLQDKQLVSPKFEKSITVAGNLDVEKCAYIKDLSKLNGIDIHLYGPNYDEQLNDFSNVHYHGSFPPNEIPNHLNAGFGLVWDGNSIDGCKGDSGQYLRFNNPHKLSLYLSSGLPVVLWDGAAEAGFIKKYYAGICVDSLYDLSKGFELLSEEEYLKIAENVKQLGKKLQNGEYGKKAIAQAEKVLIDEI